jgi:hypothetical protein
MILLWTECVLDLLVFNHLSMFCISFGDGAGTGDKMMRLRNTAERNLHWETAQTILIYRTGTQVYKYKVVSTSFNDDIYDIEIIYLEEKLHVLVNLLAMGSLVWWCCHQLTIII